MNLNVLSLNIHKGFTQFGGFSLNAIREAIRTSKADLVFLQEVLGDHKVHKKRLKDYPQESQFEFLADTVWSHHAYGKNAVYTNGHHGNAILSSYPIKAIENIDVSTNPLERRGLLHCVIELPNIEKPLHAICLHLNLMAKSRLKQAKMLAKRIEAAVPNDAPLIVAGDFNDWQEQLSSRLEDTCGLSEVFKVSTGEHAKTFPTWRPTVSLDRIYVRGLEIETTKVYSDQSWSGLSDHLAISANLNITGGKK